MTGVDGRGLNVLDFPGVVGDGVHDDTKGIQLALASKAQIIHLPQPPKNYLISDTLVVQSGQTVIADRSAVIRLADGANAHMVTNSAHRRGNEYITLIGGVWDGNNASQDGPQDEQGEYRPARYLGAIMRFNSVSSLHIADLTLKDPRRFGFQLGNLDGFSIENITFDCNDACPDVDGIHIHGNCSRGRISDLHGATSHDIVSLSADEEGIFEMSRGEISDIQVVGIWARDAWTAVRVVSAGSTIRRVCITGIHGSFCCNVASFGNRRFHPGEPSIIEDVSIDGIYCSKPTKPMREPSEPDGPEGCLCPMFWVEGGTRVDNLEILNLARVEQAENAPPSIGVCPKAEVGCLDICNASQINLAKTPLDFLVNQGVIETLNLMNIVVRAEGPPPRGCVVRNTGQINHRNIMSPAISNLVGMEGK